jgi:hypothetical protein
LPGVPPRKAILITIQGALEDMRTIQKDLGGSSGSSLKMRGLNFQNISAKL